MSKSPKTPLLPGMAGAGVEPWHGRAPAAVEALPPPPAPVPGFLPGLDVPSGDSAWARRLDAKHRARINSPGWINEVRPRIIARAAGFCERCNHRTDKFEVHHLNYDRLGHEEDFDLQAVCPVCHPKADKERQAAFACMAEAALEAAKDRALLDKFFPDGDLPDDAVEQVAAWRAKKEEEEYE